MQEADHGLLLGLEVADAEAGPRGLGRGDHVGEAEEAEADEREDDRDVAVVGVELDDVLVQDLARDVVELDDVHAVVRGHEDGGDEVVVDGVWDVEDRRVLVHAFVHHESYGVVEGPTQTGRRARSRSRSWT